MFLRAELARTEHSDLGRLTVSLTDHVGAHADVHTSVALPRVGDHQLSSTDLKESTGTLRSHAISYCELSQVKCFAQGQNRCGL